MSNLASSSKAHLIGEVWFKALVQRPFVFKPHKIRWHYVQVQPQPRPGNLAQIRTSHPTDATLHPYVALGSRQARVDS